MSRWEREEMLLFDSCEEEYRTVGDIKPTWRMRKKERGGRESLAAPRIVGFETWD